MGTYNPIGLALRDVGAGFGGLLDAQARRQEAANQQQVALGQLGLQGVQLQNQGRVQEAQAGVNLAQAANEGRYREATVASQQEQNRIAALEQTARQQHLVRSDAAANLAQVSLDTYHKAQAKFQQDDLTARTPGITATANLAQANADTLNADKPQDFTVWFQALRQDATARYGPEVAAQMQQDGLGAGQVLLSSFLERYPKDANGRIMLRPSQASDLLKILGPYMKADTLTEDQKTRAIENAVKILTNDGKNETPAPHAWTIATALVTKKREYIARMPGIDAEVKTYELNATNDILRANGGTEPTPGETQAFLANYAQTHNGEAARMDTRQGFQGRPDADLPEWQKFRNAALLKSGAKPPSEAQATAIRRAATGYQDQNHLRAATEVLGGMAPAPQGTARPVSSASAETWKQRIVEGAARRGLDPAIALSVFTQESSLSPNAPAEAGGTGGFSQFQEATARDRKLDLQRLRNDPDYNLNAGLDYLADLKKQHGEKDLKYVEAYNGLGRGAGDPNYVANVRKWLPAHQEWVRRRGAAPPPPSEPPRQKAFAERTLAEHLATFDTTIHAPKAGGWRYGEPATGAPTAEQPGIVGPASGLALSPPSLAAAWQAPDAPLPPPIEPGGFLLRDAPRPVSVVGTTPRIVSPTPEPPVLEPSGPSVSSQSSASQESYVLGGLRIASRPSVSSQSVASPSLAAAGQVQSRPEAVPPERAEAPAPIADPLIAYANRLYQRELTQGALPDGTYTVPLALPGSSDVREYQITVEGQQIITVVPVQ